MLAVFAALLLYNFISASINAKKQDIGILRAVGARGIDVFLFDALNALIVFAIAFVTAAVSTSVPVALTVKKRPVEAIRTA